MGSSTMYGRLVLLRVAFHIFKVLQYRLLKSFHHLFCLWR